MVKWQTQNTQNVPLRRGGSSPSIRTKFLKLESRSIGRSSDSESEGYRFEPYLSSLRNSNEPVTLAARGSGF